MNIEEQSSNHNRNEIKRRLDVIACDHFHLEVSSPNLRLMRRLKPSHSESLGCRSGDDLDILLILVKRIIGERTPAAEGNHFILM